MKITGSTTLAELAAELARLGVSSVSAGMNAPDVAIYAHHALLPSRDSRDSILSARGVVSARGDTLANALDAMRVSVESVLGAHRDGDKP